MHETPGELSSDIHCALTNRPESQLSDGIDPQLLSCAHSAQSAPGVTALNSERQASEITACKHIEYSLDRRAHLHGHGQTPCASDLPTRVTLRLHVTAPS